MAANPEQQAATLKEFVHAWERWDAAAMLSTFSEDFVQITLPLALNVPPRSRAEVQQTLPLLVDTVKSYNLTIHNTIHDKARNNAALYAMSTGELPWDDVWSMEYAAFVTFTPDGTKIAKLEEMLDSKEFQRFAPRFLEHRLPRITLPLALNVPPRSRAEVQQTLPLLVDTVKSYNLTIHNTIHDKARNNAALYAMSTGELPWDDVWSMEYAAFVTFTPDGTKIAKLEEMLDSKEFQRFAPRFLEHRLPRV
nr:hypothetical protein CFP56_33438 [Quercus suber]